MTQTPWYAYPINVPYGNANYDKALGGSHDLDTKTPLNTPVTAIADGTISSIETKVPWGQQVTVKFDNPYNGVPYYALLHLGSIRRGLAVGQHVSTGTVLGTSGGANSVGSAQGTYVDDPSQSSGPQTGLALTMGADYGFGAGWAAIQSKLDPTPIINALRGSGSVPNTSNCVAPPWYAYLPLPGIGDPTAVGNYAACSATDNSGTGTATGASAIMALIIDYGERIALFLIALIIIIIGFILLAGKQIEQGGIDAAKVAML